MTPVLTANHNPWCAPCGARYRTILPVAYVLVLLGLGPVQAADIRFNGFGTVAAGISLDEDETLFGYDEDFDFEPESLFALQATAELSDRLAATAQLIGRGRDDFEPEFEWAYLSYDLSDNWNLKGGQVRLPLYLYSDFLDVGYAFPFLRVPQTVYGDIDISSITGLNLSNRFLAGALDGRIELLAGRFDDEILIAGVNFDTELRNAIGATAEVGVEWLRLRLAYVHAEVSAANPDVDALTAGLAMAGFADIADDIALERDSGYFAGLGLRLQLGGFFSVAEYTRVEIADAFIPDADSYYASLGYRFGDFTLYGIIEANRDDGKDFADGLPPGPPFDSARQLLAAQDGDDDGYALGLRWDFSLNAALKADYTHRSPAAGEDVGVVSTAVVFTF